MKRVVIIDVGAGNLHSVHKAFVRAGDRVPHQLSITTYARDVAQADAIVLPGVGAFADCMAGLNALAGMRDMLEEKRNNTPIFGICVGMQMLFARGHEYGEHAGLGWVAGEVKPLTPTDTTLRIPHMGWNRLELRQPEHPCLRNIAEGAHVYFVHSYHAVGACAQDIAAEVDYGGKTVAIIARDNLFATQFHPEKSQRTGLRMIENFLRM